VIALIDYKAGNLTSVRKALGAIGAEVATPESPDDLKSASGVIVPGVGHFGATRALDRAWVDAILSRVGEGRPLLGICLGMQWLYEASDEAPELAGLGVFGGRCYRLSGEVRLKPDATPEPDATPDANVGSGFSRMASVKVPHVGWNSLAIRRDAPILAGVPDGSQVYFTHSFVAPVTSDTAASTEHGEAFASVVQRGHISGVQFHPEKSGDVGLRILRNFLELTR